MALHSLFQEFPSLASIFEKEYVHFSDFSNLEYILETCFIDDFLFPDNEDFPLTSVEDGKFVPSFLDEYQTFFSEYIVQLKENHLKFQKSLEDDFNPDLKLKDLLCKCTDCVTDYRATLRDHTYRESVDLIENSKDELARRVKKGDSEVAEVYRDLQKSLDKKFYNLRFKLKRSTLNRLEGQVKSRLKGELNYPGDLAKLRVKQLVPKLEKFLKERELKPDLISEEEYERWYSLLGSNIWRGEKYLDTEFKKFVKSILTLKRKDISAGILKDYLGQFWAYSQARQIKRKIIYHMGLTNSIIMQLKL